MTRQLSDEERGRLLAKLLEDVSPDNAGQEDSGFPGSMKWFQAQQVKLLLALIFSEHTVNNLTPAELTTFINESVGATATKLGMPEEQLLNQAERGLKTWLYARDQLWQKINALAFLQEEP